MIPVSKVPINLNDIQKSIYYSIKCREKSNFLLKKELSQYLKCSSENIIITNSGTTAIYSILNAHLHTNKREVLLPAYICETLVPMIQSMGFKVKLVDIESDSYNMDPLDLHEKITDDTLLVIAAHMFGYPCRIKKIIDICKNEKVLVLEDAAQALGSEYVGKKSGTFGDVGVFSLGVGKPITTINGGIITIQNQDLKEQLTSNILTKDLCGSRLGIKSMLKTYLYMLATNPHIYTFASNVYTHPKSAPQFDNNQMYSGFSNYQALLGYYQLKRLDQLNDIRKKNANYLISLFDSTAGVIVPSIKDGEEPIHLRLPVYFPEKEPLEIDHMIKELRISGVEATRYLNVSLNPAIKEAFNTCPNFTEKYARTITLPTHPSLNKRYLHQIGKIINGYRRTHH